MHIVNRLLVFGFLLVVAATSRLVAQGDGELIDIDIDLGREAWYENPWVWAGVGVFLLIALFILRRGGKR